MKRLRNAALNACLFSLPLSATLLHAQTVAMQTTTQERLEAEPWWPTQPNLPLQAFAGSNACVRCHTDEASPNSMRHASEPARDASFLNVIHPRPFTSRPFTYSLTPTPAGIAYTVADGPHKLSHTLDWVMGAGVLGRTFLYQIDDHWYQSAISLYTDQSALDITTGLSRDPGNHLSSALGQILSPDDARHCFACHTVHSTTSQGFNPLHAEAGLGCEACHGPGLAHANQMTAAAKSAASSPPADTTNIFDPSKLSPVDANDFCGSCHRSFADATLSMAQAHAFSTAVVRFQPYRLEESRCWRETQDERLTCVACHNPHKPLNHDTTSYDNHCLQCHAPTSTAQTHPAKVCPKSTHQCVTCHMPKVPVASMHGTFTDHFIRVVHPDQGFPQ
jgi:hypothetical protein